MPDENQAALLLAELAAAPCEFSPVPADRPLALYGARSLGRVAHDFLSTVGREFAVIIDRNARQLAQEPCWSGLRLVHPEDISSRDKSRLRVAVSIVTALYVPLEQTLRRLGCADVVPFYETLPACCFFFRLHSWCSMGAVVYAIPNERNRPT